MLLDDKPDSFNYNGLINLWKVEAKESFYDETEIETGIIKETKIKN